MEGIKTGEVKTIRKIEIFYIKFTCCQHETVIILKFPRLHEEVSLIIYCSK